MLYFRLFCIDWLRHAVVFLDAQRYCDWYERKQFNENRWTDCSAEQALLDILRREWLSGPEFSLNKLP